MHEFRTYSKYRTFTNRFVNVIYETVNKNVASNRLHALLMQCDKSNKIFLVFTQKHVFMLFTIYVGSAQGRDIP